MMKLSTMTDIVRACGGQHGNSVADSLPSLWFCDHSPLEFVRISANCIFKFQAEGQVFFLRFNTDTERSLEQLEAEIDFVNFLAGSGVRVAKPVQSLNGSYIESTQSGIGTLHAVVFEALPGIMHSEVPDLPHQLLSAWGRSLGELHRKAEEYKSSGLRLSWGDHLKLIETYLPEQEQNAWKVLEQVSSKLNDLPIHDGNYGLIHYDLELDNLIWDGNTPGMLDFDDCAHYWYVADIAFALRDIFDDRADRVDFRSEAYQRFIEGYKSARDISEGELQLIPLFLTMHNLTRFAKLIRAIDEKRPEEPEWMEGLRLKLHNKLQSDREAFAEYVEQ